MAVDKKVVRKSEFAATLKKPVNVFKTSRAKISATAQQVLICTMGDTPQIITETIWALLNQDPPWQPDRIDIVTTCYVNFEGKINIGRLVEQIFEADGAFKSLPWKGDIPAINVVVPKRTHPPTHIYESASSFKLETLDNSNLLTDVDNGEDAMCMGEAIFACIRQAKLSNPPANIHVSLAGGRKTMSAHALMALTMLSDGKDRASHTLIPSVFENHPKFWHPDHNPDLELSTRPPNQITFTPSHLRGKVSLFDVPVFPVAKLLNKSAREQVSSLAQMIDYLTWERDFTNDPSVYLGPPGDGAWARIGGKNVSLTWKMYAALWIIAKARKETTKENTWATRVLTKDGPSESCFAKGCINSERLEAYIDMKKNFTALESKSQRSSNQPAVKNRDDELHIWLSDLKKSKDSYLPPAREDEFMRPIRDGLSDLKSRIGPFVDIVQSSGRGGDNSNPDWWYALNCSPENISFSNKS